MVERKVRVEDLVPLKADIPVPSGRVEAGPQKLEQCPYSYWVSSAKGVVEPGAGYSMNPGSVLQWKLQGFGQPSGVLTTWLSAVKRRRHNRLASLLPMLPRPLAQVGIVVIRCCNAPLVSHHDFKAVAEPPPHCTA